MALILSLKRPWNGLIMALMGPYTPFKGSPSWGLIQGRPYCKVLIQPHRVPGLRTDRPPWNRMPYYKSKALGLTRQIPITLLSLKIDLGGPWGPFKGI